jgi:hypothetical protein
MVPEVVPYLLSKSHNALKAVLIFLSVRRHQVPFFLPEVICS